MKIRKYSDFKKRNIFETYEPEERIELKKEHTIPILYRIGNKFLFLGGLIGLSLSGLVIGVKEFFSFKNKIYRKIRKGKVVEFRIKK